METGKTTYLLVAYKACHTLVWLITAGHFRSAALLPITKGFNHELYKSFHLLS